MADQKHGNAFPGNVDDFLPDKLYGAHINSPGGVLYDQEVIILEEFTAHNGLLDIAA